METALTITTCELPEVLPVLARIGRPKYDTSGGLATVQDVCKAAQIFKVEQGGHLVGAYALETLEFDRGVCVWVSAGAGMLEGVDLASTMAGVVETQARAIGAQQVGMITKRRGLIKKLAAQGWTVAGVKMVKKI